MKFKLILLLFFSVSLAVIAQTNFDVLICKNEVAYTNVVILRSTPLSLIVSYSDGITGIPLTNLPDFLAAKYPFDTNRAAAFAEAAKQKKIAEAKARLERQKYIASLRGSNQTIRIIALLDDFGKCQTSVGQIYILGLPASVTAFYARRAELEMAIANLKNTPITVTATVNDPNDPDPGFTSQLMAQDALSNEKEARREKLTQLQHDLDTLNETEIESTTITAYSTGLPNNGIMQWQCVGSE